MTQPPWHPNHGPIPDVSADELREAATRLAAIRTAAGQDQPHDRGGETHIVADDSADTEQQDLRARAERAEAEQGFLAAAANPAGVAVRAIQLMQEAGAERDRLRAELAQAYATSPTCICGHTEAQHFEDACITEVTGCTCGAYLEPQDAAEVIDRWRQAATQARAELAQARSATTPAHVWQVWQDDQPIHALYATEDDARQGSIDCWRETEPSCPDYGWAPDGPRLELLVGGERGGVYISRQTVYGDSYVTARSATLTEAIAAVEDPARRSGLGWESARDVLRRMAAEAQQAPSTADPS